jgi:GNAT superfamily N-acetyltransferase
VIEIRLPRVADEVGCTTLAAQVIGEERAGAFIRSHLERHHLIVAEAEREVVGFLAYRVDWFQCTFVTLTVVREDFRRKGIAREFFKSVEAVSPTPRLFSSTEETNVASIRMHTALGFVPSGHIDNLPQGVRELLFYKRIPPRGWGGWGQVLHYDISARRDLGDQGANVVMQDLTPRKA